MKPRTVRLEHVATSPRAFPKDGRAEIVLMGRSNVGKSSLLNRLLGRRSIARVSKTPGRTREIHFYGVDDRWYYVDLPGYGYARVPDAVRRQWGKMVTDYLEGREQIALALHLVDSRHDPTALDESLSEMLVAGGLPFAVALTKCDKMSRSAAARAAAQVRRTLDLPRDAEVFPTSASTGDGVKALTRAVQTAVSRHRAQGATDVAPGEGA